MSPSVTHQQATPTTLQVESAKNISAALIPTSMPCPLQTDAAHPPYNPMKVPPRNPAHPSIRDDVRRTLHAHSFRPSLTHYTRIRDIYHCFLEHHSKTHTSALNEKFRSALGRVIRPPANANVFAHSYAAPDARRWNDFIGLRSPVVPCVELKAAVKAHKWEQGRKRREEAANSDSVSELRERRSERKRKPPQTIAESAPQHISFRYVDEFVGLDCAEDLMRLKLYPNGKELAESMSAFAMVRLHLLHREDESANKNIVQTDASSSIPSAYSSPGVKFNDRRVVLLAVGDGVTPRTAGLFAYRTQWRCISVDPQMRSGAWDGVTNLTMHRACIEDVCVNVEPDERVIVVMWHAHVGVKDALSCLRLDGRGIVDDGEWKTLRGRVAVVSCACCNYDEVQRELPDGSPPDVEEEDIGVPGLMRMVRIWKFTNGEPPGQDLDNGHREGNEQRS